MNNDTPRFYRFGDLPPRADDVAKVRRALRRGPLGTQALVDRTGLSKNRTLCSIDALVASGEVTYDTETRLFSIRTEG